MMVVKRDTSYQDSSRDKRLTFLVPWSATTCNVVEDGMELLLAMAASNGAEGLAAGRFLLT